MPACGLVTDIKKEVPPGLPYTFWCSIILKRKWLRYGNEWKSLGTFLHSAAMGILSCKCGIGVNIRRVCVGCIVSYRMLSHLHAQDWSISVGTW